MGRPELRARETSRAADPGNPGVTVPFNRPYLTGDEQAHLARACDSRHLAGDGEYTRACARWLEERTGTTRALLTHSCTAALEMAALLLNLKPGDEVIMPSYTFVSTANAFVLRGAVPVFVDVRRDTLNIDESLIEAAITERTRAIVPVHYGGVACAMDEIVDIAGRHGLAVVEDAAQGLGAAHRGRALGSIGQLGCLSFHETKNIVAGEGGALLVNDPGLVRRAEIIREKGTNRSQFLRGEVDKYSWCDIGSSYLPSELTAAFLWPQLRAADEITARRLAIWERYHDAFAPLEEAGLARRPVIPDGCGHNAHTYYLLLPSQGQRATFVDALRARGIAAVSHYVPLHSSAAGLRFGRTHGSLRVTEDLAARVARLPLWVGVEDCVDHVIDAVATALHEGLGVPGRADRTAGQ